MAFVLTVLGGSDVRSGIEVRGKKWEQELSRLTNPEIEKLLQDMKVDRQSDEKMQRDQGYGYSPSNGNIITEIDRALKCIREKRAIARIASRRLHRQALRAMLSRTAVAGLPEMQESIREFFEKLSATLLVVLTQTSPVI